MGPVVVDAQVVQRRADRRQVALADQRVGRQQLRVGLGGVGAVQDRVHADAVVVGIELRCHRLGVLAQRPVRVRVQRDAHRHCRRQRGAERLERQPVAEEDVMGRRRGQAHVAMARSVRADPVALVHGLLGLVERGPHAHPVAQGIGEHAGVLRQQLGGVTARPPALVLERLGQLPVVHGGHRDDAVRPQLVHQRAVVVQPRLVDRAAAAGQHPRPGDREAVGADAELGQQATSSATRW